MLTLFYDTLPENFLDTPARELHRCLLGPTLIHLSGRRPRPLFVSVLLHGNEDCGLVAVQNVLRRYHGQMLPRALSILVGNVAAARHGLRRLDEQPDYNRVWPGNVAHGQTPEHAAMCEVYRQLAEREVFASIDIHNNTGLNPHYAVVNRLDAEVLHLARLFARTVVWFRGLPGSQTNAFSPRCPSVTIECGKPGVAANEIQATRFLDACLHLDHFPDHQPSPADLDVYHTLATVRVSSRASFAFGDSRAEIDFEPRLDHLNFCQLAAGTVFGRSRLPHPLEVYDESGQEVSDDFFVCDDGILRLRRAVTPAMLSLDLRVVRQDCLCYLMDRLPVSHWSQTRQVQYTDA
ncbi:MAG TPA: M14 family metallopeptidase [Accumulibacter sp.]|nr:M14 family metallopeptidase [Accumulibacter sp.]HMW16380.1 M14 family metallopeptidase [Accumulibacter sp.]HMX21479.1 M14 family metallopeptidase [Accumulibacter sp.]HMY07939.1 M14 family metallopeptidase [Accumulibacter sp.]HNC17391.1 M14 family metallopeptidase [Accumulibacter sp.]